MENPEHYDGPFTAQERRQVGKWLLFFVAVLSLVFFLVAHSVYGLLIGWVLALPGLPLAYLVLGHWHLDGSEVLRLFEFAPIMTVVAPCCLWLTLALTDYRFILAFGLALALFAIISGTGLVLLDLGII